MGKRTSIYCDEDVLQKIKKKYPTKSVSSVINELLISDLENSPFSVETTTVSEVKKMKSEVKRIREELSSMRLLLVNQENMFRQQSNDAIMTNRKIDTISEDLKEQSEKHYYDLLDGIKKLGNVSIKKLEWLLYLSNYIAYALYKDIEEDSEIADYQLEDLIGSEKAYIILNAKIEKAMKKDKRIRQARYHS